MAIKIIRDQKLPIDEINIFVSPLNKQVDDIINMINSDFSDFINGKKDEKIYIVKLSDVESFYTQDGYIKFYANEQEYRTGKKLFELEQKFLCLGFLRISKSTIINIKKVEYLSSILNQQLLFKMESGKEEYSSRSYYNKIRNALGV